jgi:hypothetical protein
LLCCCNSPLRRGSLDSTASSPGHNEDGSRRHKKRDTIKSFLHIGSRHGSVSKQRDRSSSTTSNSGAGDVRIAVLYRLLALPTQCLKCLAEACESRHFAILDIAALHTPCFIWPRQHDNSIDLSNSSSLCISASVLGILADFSKLTLQLPCVCFIDPSGAMQQLSAPETAPRLAGAAEAVGAGASSNPSAAGSHAGSNISRCAHC